MEDYDWKYRTLSRFLCFKVIALGRGHHIPHFYGISKIHKEPVKLRPILPCHSIIQNPAAKFVSKMLKPLIADTQIVIIGSKDLAIKLSQQKPIPGHKFYIVTGDVVPYYPSLPLGKCLEHVYTTCSVMGSGIMKWMHGLYGNIKKYLCSSLKTASKLITLSCWHSSTE